MKKKVLLYSVACLLASQFSMAQPTVPGNPAAGNASNCTTTAAVGGAQLDACAAGSTTFVSTFQGGSYVNNSGDGNNSLALNAVWRFANIGTTSGGTVINAQVKVDKILNATLTNMDDNSGTDQAGVSVASFFAPVIAPDQSLNLTDRRGYIQFTVSFFDANLGNGYNNAVTMNNLNFVSYDADGNYNTGGNSTQTWFRETRVAQLYAAGNPTVLANASSELIAYNYPDVSPASTWNGFAGGVYERTGISRCAEVASSFRYGSGANGRSSVTFRFGYDFKAGSGYNVGNPGRQYGARFGCYNFPSQNVLPVRLLSFNGVYKNQQTLLNWAASNQVNFSAYEIERSLNGTDFSTIGTKQKQGNGLETQQYNFSDDLAQVNNDVFFYRLRMVDVDGKFNYSNVIMIRKSGITSGGLNISPSPVAGSTAIVRFTATAKSSIELKIVDMAGRVVMKQQSNVYEGTNSITLSNVDRLQSGIYLLQMLNNGELTTAKFSIAR